MDKGHTQGLGQSHLKSTKIWWKSFIGLAFCLIYPSIALFKKIGYSYLFAYSVGALLILWVVLFWLLPFLKTRISIRRSIVLLALLLISLFLAYFVIHPHIDTRGFSFFGKNFGASDGDDAIDLAISEIIHGRYPYAARTFLDNPITPMPGALLLALPFYILGDSGVQNLFWLAIFLILLARYNHDSLLPVSVAYILCFFSPIVVYHILTGSDYIANSIYTLVFTIMVLDSARGHKSDLQCIFWSVLLGIGLSSRINFALNLILLFFMLLKVTSKLKALGMVTITLASFIAITLPAFVHSPSTFSPLHTSNMLSIGGKFMWAPFSIPLLGALIALYLSLISNNDKSLLLARNIFIVQVFLVLSGQLLASIVKGHVSLEYPHFGVLFLFYGIWAFGPRTLS